MSSSLDTMNPVNFRVCCARWLKISIFLQVTIRHYKARLLLGTAGMISLFLPEACSDLFELRACDGRDLLTSETLGSCVRVQPVNCRHRNANRRASAQLCCPQQGCARVQQAGTALEFGYHEEEQLLPRGTESLSHRRHGSVGMTTPGNIEVNWGTWTRRLNSVSQLLCEHDLLLMGNGSIYMDGHRVYLMAIIWRGACQESEEV